MKNKNIKRKNIDTVSHYDLRAIKGKKSRNALEDASAK